MRRLTSGAANQASTIAARMPKAQTSPVRCSGMNRAMRSIKPGEVSCGRDFGARPVTEAFAAAAAAGLEAASGAAVFSALAVLFVASGAAEASVVAAAGSEAATGVSTVGETEGA